MILAFQTHDSNEISPLRVCILAFIVGVAGAICQVSIIRESIWLLRGSELSIGAVLALWLAGSALGSALLARFLIQKSLLWYIRLFLLLPLLFLVQLIVAREVRAALTPVSGTLLPFTDSLLLSVILSIPFSACAGALFALACRVTGASSSSSITRVYIFETAGAAAGAALFAFLLVWFSPVTLCALIGILSSLVIFSLVRRGVTRLSTVLPLVAFSLWLILHLSGTLKSLDYETREDSLGARSVVSVRETRSGNITVTKTPEGAQIFVSGTLIVPNPPAAEEVVHTTLLSHPSPGKVLLVGGVLEGLVCDIIKHPVSEVTCVEPDPQSVGVLYQYLPLRIADCLKLPTVRVVETDGRLLVGRKGASYDCIIVALGEPSTGLLNRFFTVDFFSDAYKSLTDEGIISIALPLSPGRVPQRLLEMIASVKKSVEAVFPSVTLVAGERAGALILACKKANFLASGGFGETIAERFEERKIASSWLTSELLAHNTVSFRTSQLRSQVAALSAEQRIPFNRDLNPLCYLYSLLLWQKRVGEEEFLLSMRSVSVAELSLLVAIVCALFCAFVWKFRSSRLASGTAACAVGFSAISFQMLLLLAFQSICGNLYAACALFLCLFMLGLLGGSLVGRRAVSASNSHSAVALTLLLLAGAVYLLLVSGLLSFSGALYNAFPQVTTYLVFPLSSGICGFITGFVFPTANSLYLRDLPDSLRRGRSAPMIYALDLCGAGLGALLATFYFVPVIGVTRSLHFLSLLLLLAAFPCAVLIFLSRRQEK